MCACRRMFALTLVCLAPLSGAQLSDQRAASRVLGPHWKEMSRVAGMVFSGTVLGVEEQRTGKGRPFRLILTKFRVDRAIAGVQTGQVLTVREWAGVWSMHRAMRRGEHMLILLYPASRLGLTSPVGGSLGQVVLDSRDEIVRTSPADAGLDSASAARLKSCPPQNLELAGRNPTLGRLSTITKRFPTPNSAPPGNCAAAARFGTTLRQLERAIRNARRDSSSPPARITE
jgi:hypothetical protein